MTFISNLSLTWKLVVIAVGTAAVSLVMSIVFMSVNQGFAYRTDLSTQLVTVARAIGSNNVAATIFEDEALGRQALSALENESAFREANLYDRNGSRLARYEGVRFGDGPARPLDPALLLQAVNTQETATDYDGFDVIDVIEPVVYDDELIGFVHIRSGLDSVMQRLQRSVLFAVGVLAFAMLFALVMALRMQRMVSQPIRELVDVTRRVSQDSDYSARASYRSDDEIGVLVAAFHEMLDQIGERDQRLQENRKRLAERSESLTAANEELKIAIQDSIEARDAAESASRAKSEFLARMSHEIRTPMNGVIGMLELLSRTQLNSNQRHYVSTIDQSAETLMAVINDILDFSKIESGKLALDFDDLHVREAVESVVELLAPRAHEKQVEIVCEVQRDADLTVRGDGVRLRQIVMNLLGNAVKFTSDGEIRVAVSAVKRAADAVRLRFEVSDTGIGISPDKQEHVFDSFSQEDGSTTRKYGGTGLGLSICRELVNLMGGEIGVDSEPGRGSCFWFEVGFDVVAVEKTELMEEQLAGHHVLIVDDNATNREMLTGQLEHWFMTSVAADGAVAGLKALRAAKTDGRLFDLILLDWHMPDVDGLMFAEELSRHEEFSGIPIMLLTSASVSEILAGKADTNVAAYITKPVRQTRLRDALLHVLLADRDASVAPIEDQLPARESLAGLRVLLVEDNRINQEVARGMLQNLDCEVEVVSDGQQAVNMLAEQDFDVVLMDCQMPVMDGYQATAAIREREAGTGKHQLVVALTANALPEDRDRCLDAGMDDYLSKPFSIDKIRDVLMQWANVGQAASA